MINTFDKDGKELGQWVKNADGSTEVKRDDQGNPIYTRIANKSKAIATVSAYRVMFNGKPLVQPQINKLKITELIEYVPPSNGVTAEEEEEAL